MAEGLSQLITEKTAGKTADLSDFFRDGRYVYPCKTGRFSGILSGLFRLVEIS